VPRGWAEDPRLASWVKNQRKHKRKLDRGEPGQGMTAARAAKLTALGFAWDPSTAAKCFNCGEVGHIGSACPMEASVGLGRIAALHHAPPIQVAPDSLAYGVPLYLKR
jgi:hypothetical protein